MFATLFEHLKLILLFIMITTIVSLSWFGNERWIKASRPGRRDHAGVRGRKARFSRADARQRNPPKAGNPKRISTQWD
jgi:hypothetical protein